MFFFMAQPFLIYHWILILAAVIPAIFLMVKVYTSDHLEKESKGLLMRLVRGGILSALLALIEERLGEWLLGKFVAPENPLYNILMFFIVVAVSEETSKYIFMKRETWQNPEFNCQYDGVVYAVFVSLGFALWENISYVLSYGFSTALVRAVTAIPGHASFGVFMGVFYGLSKKAEVRGDTFKSGLFRVFSILVPVLMHGAYDYLATKENEDGSGYFLIFVVILFVVSFATVHIAAKKDRFFVNRRGPADDVIDVNYREIK